MGLIQSILLAASIAIVPAAQAQELKFGFTPVVSEAEMRVELEPLIT
jgi:hypothetical protein